MSEQKPPACVGCPDYVGQSFGRDLLHCAMHPYGPEGEACPDNRRKLDGEKDAPESALEGGRHFPARPWASQAIVGRTREGLSEPRSAGSFPRRFFVWERWRGGI